MSALALLSPALRRNLLVLFVAGLMFWTSMGSLLPTLPLYVRDAGGSGQQIGLVIGAFSLGLLLSRSWLGKLADRRSRRLVLLIGMATACLAPLGYGLTQSIPVMMGIRAFHGISIAAFATGYVTLVVDMSPEKHRGEVIGYMSLVNPIGGSIGPALGGFLQVEAGYSALFSVASLLGVVGLVSTSQVQEPALHPRVLLPGSELAFWPMLLDVRIRILTVVLLLFGLSFGTLSTFVPLRIEEAGVDLNPGLFYAVGAAASFGVRLLVGSASDRYGRGLFLSLSLASYAVAMGILWFADSALTFLAAGLIEGVGFGILIPLVSALIADRSDGHERGRMFSLCMSGFDLGIGLAGPILGSVAEQTSYQVTFGLAAGMGLLSLLVFATLANGDLAHSLGFAVGRSADRYAQISSDP